MRARPRTANRDGERGHVATAGQTLARAIDIMMINTWKWMMAIAIAGGLGGGCTAGTDLGRVAEAIATLPDGGVTVDAVPVPLPALDAGTPAMTKVTTDNQPNSTTDVLRDGFVRAPTKPAQIKTVGALDATLLPSTPPVASRTSAIGGTCVTVSNIPDGYFVGSSGAEGCIIAVIVTCDGTTIACHFTATDNPVTTLNKLAPFGACAHAAIAGGTNEAASNNTLMRVLDGLAANDVSIDGYLDRIGVFWDAANGRWVYGPLDQPSQNR